MVESSASLTQRVEALEQMSHARVVERVGQVEQRVSRIESAREAEEPHVATKADIARLETLVVEFRAESQAQNAETRAESQAQLADFRAESQAQLADFRAEMLAQLADFRAEMLAQLADFRAESQAQNAATRSDLEEKINAVNAAGERRLRHFLMWLIGTAIALAAVIIAAVAAIVGQLL